jgi:hypothetical protein
MPGLNHPPMGVITTGIFPNSEVIGGNQPESKPAQYLDAMAFLVNALDMESAAANDLVRVLRSELDEADYQRAITNDPNRSTKGLTADELAAERFEAEANVSRARKAYEAAVARSREVNRVLNIARRHLRGAQLLYQRTDNFVAVKPTPLPRGQTADEVIAPIDAERIKVSKAMRPLAELKAELMGQVDGWASDARIRISFGEQPTIGVPVIRVAAESSSPGEVPHSPDPRPWLALLHRDVLEAQIDEALNAKYEGVTLQLSDRDKAKRLKELAAERLNADHIRCAAIWAKHEADPTAPLDFPADADPRAILGIEGEPVRLRDDED